MLRSMTGFGAARSEADGVYCSVELRSVNNKFFKAQLRMPESLLALEADVESALARQLARGSVTASVRYDAEATSEGSRIDQAVFRRLLTEMHEATPPGMREWCTVDLSGLLGVDGVMASDPPEAIVERARETVLTLVAEACTLLISMREREGAALAADLEKHRLAIDERLEVIRERAPLVVEQYQERLRQRMMVLLQEVGASVSDEDLLREVAVYAERTDIAEEVVRLAGHLDQLERLLLNDGDQPVGRTLDFLSQEMLREANTIASKCADVVISRNIVEIKGAIDRVKEQAANAE